MSKMCIVIMENEKDEFGYIPCVITEGEHGYRPTDWNWGNDREIAEKLATDYNTKLDITPTEKNEMVMQSMKKQKMGN